MTWKIWQIFSRALDSLQKWDFDEILISKVYNYELKIHRGVTCHDKKEWCEIWKEIDLSFQNWHEEFEKFWPEHSKSLKHMHFNGLLLNKAYNVWDKESTDKLCFMILKSDSKFEEKLICGLENDEEFFHIFTREHKSLKVGTLVGSFYPK